MNLRNPTKSKKQEIADIPRDENFFKNLKDIQDSCNHSFDRDGHDSHYEYFKCKHCGYVNRI